MAIIWNKIIPRWGGDTIEPPEAKKDTGYIAGDKPPAKWENWLRKGTYEALDETRDVIENIDSQLAQKVNKSGDTMTGNLNVPTINSKTPAYAVTPTDVTITSGFPAGWSGSIKIRKNQEGLRTVIFQFGKSSDILSTETIYTLPIELRTLDAVGTFCQGLDVSSFPIKGAFLDFFISASGALTVRNNGSITAGVRNFGGHTNNY